MRVREAIPLVVLGFTLIFPLYSHGQSRDVPGQPSVNNPNPIEGLFQGIGRFVEAALSTKDTEFKALIDSKKQNKGVKSCISVR